jgi:LysM repeat protein
MAGKDSTQNVIDSYKRRQQVMPFLIGGLAGILILGGVLLVIYWLSGPNKPAFGLFANPTETPTLTFTFTPVPPTLTVTLTPTPEATQTPEATATPSGPFEYTVLDGDFCQKIADQFGSDVRALILLNPTLGSGCAIQVGQKILIPPPGAVLPSETPLPLNIRPGTIIEYTVNPGDTIGSIATKFNSITENILKENKLTDVNNIFAYQILKVPVNLVTVVPTRLPTITPGGTQIGGTRPPTGASVTPSP